MHHLTDTEAIMAGLTRIAAIIGICIILTKVL